MSLLARLVAAGSILVVGIGVALLTRILITRVLRRVLPAQEGGPLQPQSAANGVFWFLVLVTVIISLSLLAPSLLSGVPAHVIGFPPKLGTALVMLWLAALAAGLVRGIAEGMLRRMNVAAGPVVAKAAYWAILGLGILMAADEVGVQTAVLTTVLYILMCSVGLGTALGFGFGAWRLASNVIAGRYVDDRFAVGEQIQAEDYAGTITDIGIASITIADRDGGMVEIPHRWLLDRPVRRRGSDRVRVRPGVGGRNFPETFPDGVCPIHWNQSTRLAGNRSGELVGESAGRRLCQRGRAGVGGLPPHPQG